jgi:hypothetical protein
MAKEYAHGAVEHHLVLHGDLGTIDENYLARSTGHDASHLVLPENKGPPINHVTADILLLALLHWA